MTNIIHEDKSVNADNFAFLLAQSNYNLSSVFRSKNHNETIADTPMTSADKMADDKKPEPSTLQETQSRNNQYQFKILSASTNQIADLKDAIINVVASVFAHASDSTKDLTLDDIPRLGNQALLSLFSSIELYIDSTLIERIDYPGFSANADYALRYPHNSISEKLLESNGFISRLQDVVGINYKRGDEPASPVITAIEPLYDKGFYDFSNSSVVWGLISPTTENDYLHGVITQRIRLSDIFPCINTLPPIFNHSVVVNFTRASSNRVIAVGAKPTSGNYEILTDLHAFVDFKITQDCYIITDELKKAASAYYSKPIETIFTKCKQLQIGLPTTPTKKNTTSFNISIDSAYKNKLVVFAIPRTSNFTNQPVSQTRRLDVDKTYDNTIGYTYDVAHSPANSYTHGGLASLTVYTMNGIKLHSFDISRDGTISGAFETHNKNHSLNIKQTTTNTDPMSILNYQCVYQEYLKAREQFGQLAEEGLDYETFIKEYCIFCVDLSPFSFGAGENLRVEMVFDDWETYYNPYCKNNDGTQATLAAKYISKNLYCLFYSDKVLRLLPNQNVELGDLFQIKTETDETNMI